MIPQQRFLLRMCDGAVLPELFHSKNAKLHHKIYQWLFHLLYKKDKNFTMIFKNNEKLSNFHRLFKTNEIHKVFTNHLGNNSVRGQTIATYGGKIATTGNLNGFPRLGRR